MDWAATPVQFLSYGLRQVKNQIKNPRFLFSRSSVRYGMARSNGSPPIRQHPGMCVGIHYHLQTIRLSTLCVWKTGARQQKRRHMSRKESTRLGVKTRVSGGKGWRRALGSRTRVGGGVESRMSHGNVPCQALGQTGARVGRQRHRRSHFLTFD
jgi:hypothetical protein